MADGLWKGMWNDEKSYLGFITTQSQCSLDSDLACQWDTKRKLFSLLEVCALPSGLSSSASCYSRLHPMLTSVLSMFKNGHPMLTTPAQN